MLHEAILANAIGLFLIGLLFLQQQRQTGKRLPSQAAFRRLAGFNAVMLVLDLVLWLLDSSHFPISRPLLVFAGIVLQILTPLAGLLWIAFLRSRTSESEPPAAPSRLAAAVPAALSSLLALAGAFRPDWIRIGPAVRYFHGPLPIFTPLVLLTYLGWTAVLAVRQQRLLRPHESGSLLAALLTAAAGTAAWLGFGLPLAWLANAIALLLVHLQILAEETFSDPLTGLLSRRRFDNYLDFLYSIGSFEPGTRSLGGIMIDIDNFRAINEVYGHEQGDRALESVGDILRRSVRQDDLVSRIGGDEFALVLEAGNLENLEATANRIRANVAEFNRTSAFPFALSLSMGYDLYDFESGMIPKDFFKRIDDRMLEEKRRNHNRPLGRAGRSGDDREPGAQERESGSASGSATEDGTASAASPAAEDGAANASGFASTAGSMSETEAYPERRSAINS